jgi:hypothetical protein
MKSIQPLPTQTKPIKYTNYIRLLLLPKIILLEICIKEHINMINIVNTCNKQVLHQLLHTDNISPSSQFLDYCTNRCVNCSNTRPISFSIIFLCLVLFWRLILISLWSFFLALFFEMLVFQPTKKSLDLLHN